MQGNVGEDAELARIGRMARQVRPSQVSIRWICSARGHDSEVGARERIVENAAVFDFELSDDEISAIDRCDRNLRLGADPATSTSETAALSASAA